MFPYRFTPKTSNFLNWNISDNSCPGCTIYFILSLAEKLQDDLTPKELVSGKRARKTTKK